MPQRIRFIALLYLIASFSSLVQAKADTLYNHPLKHDTLIIFHFRPQDKTFYSPYHGNDKAISLAARLIDQYREDIAAGKAYLRVCGFCGSFGSETHTRAAAKERSNHVKSWFITHHGMKEEYYRTRNAMRPYQGMEDIVALMGVQYVEGYAPATPEPIATPAPAPALQPADADSVNMQARTDTLATPTEAAETLHDSVPPTWQTDMPTGSATAQPTVHEYVPTPWYIKSNLVYDLLLMPSLEVEYRINDRWSAAVEGNMAWWHRNGKHKYYQLATIVPEVRYWFRPQGPRRGHYVGLFGGGGWYDLENGGRGYKGEGGMVGVSYGYQFPVGRYFAFEAGVGVGFMTTKYEEYLPLEGHYVYQQTSRTNYFGPLKLKFAWVWNIGRWMEKKGGGR